MNINLSADQSVQLGELVMKYKKTLHDAQMQDPTAFVRRGYWIISKEFLDELMQVDLDVRKAFCEWEDSYVKSLNFCRRTSPRIKGIALMRMDLNENIICNIEVDDGVTIQDFMMEHKWPVLESFC